MTTDHAPLMTSAVSDVTYAPLEVPTTTTATPVEVQTVTHVIPVAVPIVTSVSAAGQTSTQHVTTTLSTSTPGTIPRPDSTPGGNMCTVAGGVSPGSSRAASTQLSTATSMVSTTSSATATRVLATPLEGSVGLRGIEQRSHRSRSHALPKKPGIPSHMHLSCDILPCPHDACESQQTHYDHPVACSCPVELPVARPVLTQHRKSPSPCQPAAKGQTSEIVKNIRARSRQMKHEQGKQVAKDKETKNKTRCKTKRRHDTQTDGSHTEDGHTGALEDNKRKSKHVTRRDSPLEERNARVVGDRVGNVIGQVHLCVWI